MMVELWDHQKDALKKLNNGSVLVGDTGSGKTLTALSYYKRVLGGVKNPPKALYIITTAKKRDSGDWEWEGSQIGIDNMHVDSWNNIKKYIKVKDSMFIFDEQRVVGYGTWVKAFLKITNRNRWILLSATPADTWTDLIPVFIANGFIRNKTEFNREYVIFAPYVKYPKIVGYRKVHLLERFKDLIFVVMKYEKRTTQHITRITVEHNAKLVDEVMKAQWNPFTDAPIESLMEEVHIIRRIINSHASRAMFLVELRKKKRKLIIYYNYNFELDILKHWFGPIVTVAEYNGFKHQEIPDTDDWVYLVQYSSGSEAWETFSTNQMAFYSLNYSYRSMTQARGRIDRNNTPFDDLYYYELVSECFLDKAISKAIENKKVFNINMLDIPRVQQLL